MIILALGGCGGMGRHAVRTLAGNGWCDKIIIADKDGARAREFSDEIGGSSTWISVDVTNEKSLARSMEGVDVVMNTTGPYYRFGGMVLKASIKMGCDYIDVCDDWEPTLQMLDLNESAANAGITAIIGMGATPGISNMLAVKAIRELDEVTELFTCWNIDHAKPEPGMAKPGAATIHGIHQLTGSIRVFEDGEFRDAAPIRKRRLFYPEFGDHAVYTIGHPESVTFPRYYKSLKLCLNVFTIGKSKLFAIKILARLVKIGILDVRRAASIVETLGSLEKDDTRSGWETIIKIVESRSVFPPLFSLAKGFKNGRDKTIACTVLSAPAGGMGGATGVPLAIGARLLLKKKLGKRGVFAPEAIVDPDEFLNILAPLCSPARVNADDLVLTTRSI